MDVFPGAPAGLSRFHNMDPIPFFQHRGGVAGGIGSIKIRPSVAVDIADTERTGQLALFGSMLGKSARAGSKIGLRDA